MLRWETHRDFLPEMEPPIKEGAHDDTTQCIHIVTDLQDDRLLEVLLHEVIHAIEAILNMSFKEADVQRIAAGIQAVLMDNFQLLPRKES